MANNKTPEESSQCRLCHLFSLFIIFNYGPSWKEILPTRHTKAVNIGVSKNIIKFLFFDK